MSIICLFLTHFTCHDLFFLSNEKLYNLKYPYNYITPIVKSNNGMQHDQLNYLHFLNQPKP